MQRACYGRSALFAVESLPWKYRTEVYRCYPDLRERAACKPIMDIIIPDGYAMQFYANYVLPDGRHLTPKKQTEYSNNCAIMNAFRKCLDDRSFIWKRQRQIWMNKGTFWAMASAVPGLLSKDISHSLPKSAQGLRRKYEAYRRDGYSCFINGKYNNKNAKK